MPCRWRVLSTLALSVRQVHLYCGSREAAARATQIPLYQAHTHTHRGASLTDTYTDAGLDPKSWTCRIAPALGSIPLEAPRSWEGPSHSLWRPDSQAHPSQQDDSLSHLTALEDSYWTVSPLGIAHPTYMDAQGWHTALKVEFTGLEGWADCRSRGTGGPGPP